jgi:hypothetical protein
MQKMGPFAMLLLVVALTTDIGLNLSFIIIIVGGS